MQKQELLDIIKLLSALESWAFANKALLPDYLHEDLHRCMGVVQEELLGKGDVS
jgi:hypothetical protein